MFPAGSVRRMAWLVAVSSPSSRIREVSLHFTAAVRESLLASPGRRAPRPLAVFRVCPKSSCICQDAVPLRRLQGFSRSSGDVERAVPLHPGRATEPDPLRRACPSSSHHRSLLAAFEMPQIWTLSQKARKNEN